MRLKTLIAVAALSAAVPATASASTVSRTGTNGSTLTFVAAAGEANQVEVHRTATDVFIWERNGVDPLVGQPAGCQNYNADQVWCPASLISGVYVNGGDRDDNLLAVLDKPLTVTLFGGAGNDYVDVKGNGGGPPSPQTPNLLGGDGNDHVYGWQFSDTLSGGLGNDVLGAGRGNDRLDGGPGQDRLDGGEDSDTIYARDSYADYVACGTGTDRAQINAGEALFTGCESTF